VIVVDGGKIVADGPRDRIMEALASGASRGPPEHDAMHARKAARTALIARAARLACSSASAAARAADAPPVRPTRQPTRRTAGFRSFEQEADAVMSRRATQRAQKIVRAAVVVVLLLVLWASFAHVDEVTRGDGKVIPSRSCRWCSRSTAAWSRRSSCRKARSSRPASCC
jgi:hypothetical protein